MRFLVLLANCKHLIDFLYYWQTGKQEKLDISLSWKTLLFAKQTFIRVLAHVVRFM